MVRIILFRCYWGHYEFNFMKILYFFWNTNITYNCTSEGKSSSAETMLEYTFSSDLGTACELSGMFN